MEIETIDQQAIYELVKKLENLKNFLNKEYSQKNIDLLFNKTLIYVRDICYKYEWDYEEIIHNKKDLTIEFICPFQPHWLHLHIRNGALYIQLY